MKRYLLFAGLKYYPYGGWEDYKGEFDSIDEAEKYVQKHFEDCNWFHIVDIETKTVVKDGWLDDKK